MRKERLLTIPNILILASTLLASQNTVAVTDVKTDAKPKIQNNTYQSKMTIMLKRSHSDYFGLTPYDENYIIQSYSNGNFSFPQNMHHEEVKYQISLALPLWTGFLSKNSLLGASYTQQSWFQMTNSANSSPFRETNYEPQLFLGWATNYQLPGGWTLDEIETGINHQSNGLSDEKLKSRSWNRLYTRLSVRNGGWMVEIKPWWRIPENAKNDDNPDITHYRGYFDLGIGYDYKELQTKISSHYNWKYGRGGIQISMSYPITNHLRFYTQYYGGYGESLIDYQKNIQRIGIGVSLNNVF